jgi:hypothetical protein
MSARCAPSPALTMKAEMAGSDLVLTVNQQFTPEEKRTIADDVLAAVLAQVAKQDRRRAGDR